ncbi:hypothetical protein GCM10010464_16720 [Pseudonocardia yunnanensis]
MSAWLRIALRGTVRSGRRRTRGANRVGPFAAGLTDRAGVATRLGSCVCTTADWCCGLPCVARFHVKQGVRRADAGAEPIAVRRTVESGHPAGGGAPAELTHSFRGLAARAGRRRRHRVDPCVWGCRLVPWGAIGRGGGFT